MLNFDLGISFFHPLICLKFSSPVINGDAFKVYMKCTHKFSKFIWFKFPWILTRKIYHPKCDFWRSHDIVNTKNGIFLSWLLIFSYACNNSLFNVCVYSKAFYMYGFAYFITFLWKGWRFKEQHLTNPVSPYLWDPHGQCLVFVSFNKVGTWIFKSMPYKHLFFHKHKPKKLKIKII